MICSFKEREVHFKCNVFEGILELKRCISTVNTWNFTLLFFLLFFNFKLLKVFILNSKNFLKNFNFFTLEIYVLIFSISVKLLTLETHVCLYFANFNFFSNSKFLKILHLKYMSWFFDYIEISFHLKYMSLSFLKIFTLENYVLIFDFRTKLLSLETHVSLFFHNYFCFFKKFLI
mgnify:CR=1 FL=1